VCSVLERSGTASGLWATHAPMQILLLSPGSIGPLHSVERVSTRSSLLWTGG
jgi:hypothetical protein